MEARTLPLPSFYAAERVGEVYRVDYEAVARQAREDAARFGIQPAAYDSPRICLVLVDVQNTFCIPGFELFVPGAVEDNRRLVSFIYRNLAQITQISATLDTHRAIQIFHAPFWVRGEGPLSQPAFEVPEGAHPLPNTTITAAEVRSGAWRVNPAIAASLGLTLEFLKRHALHYVERLEQQGRFALTIWPYHAMLGGIGHALVSAVEEAVFYHTVARSSQADFELKGENALTENYSALGPEVVEGPEGADIGACRNTPLMEKLLSFDAVIIAGQAKSHCVAWTVADLLAEIQGRDPSLARRIYLLEDCSSPVVVPGVVDFTEAANEAFQRFAGAGVHLVRSDVPIAEWPGL